MADERRAKLSTLEESGWAPNRYERVYWLEDTGAGQRVVAAASEDQVEIVLHLAAVAAAGTFALLWVLHTPRGGSQPGRYQSPPLSLEEARRLLLEHRALFEQDGRGDIWIHSKDPASTIVLDRHDLIYAYGPVQIFIEVLHRLGFTVGRASIPSPHAHEYHAELDPLELALAAELEWIITELQPEDE